MLTWATQTYGFLTECAPFTHPPTRPPARPPAFPLRPFSPATPTREPPLRRYISTPKAYVDKDNYKHPVGPYQLKKFAEGAADYGVTDYYRDPNALKLIDQTEWEAVPAPAHP
jgi:hypothetical protein